jgi:hypothetical protein
MEDPLALPDPSEEAPPSPAPIPPKPYSVLLRLGLIPLIMHFSSSKTVSAATLDQYDAKIFKKILSQSARDASVRSVSNVPPRNPLLLTLS